MKTTRIRALAIVPGLVGGMLYFAAPAQAACSITAWTPWASNNLVWTGGSWSGCTAPVEVDLKWSVTGPDRTIGVQTYAVSGTAYGWGCRWGTPQNRTLYGKAFDKRGVGDESSLMGFTSAHTNCVL